VTSRPDSGGAGGNRDLEIAIDRRAEVPIGVQLAWALRARIHDGRLAPGQRLPGLRDLAQELKINANTVRAIYQRLEHEGMIESQQGRGTYVAATAHRRSAPSAIAASAAREARQTGIDPREVEAALYVEPGGNDPSWPALPERAVERRRVLHVQIATLEQLLGRIEAEHPELMSGSRAVTPPHRTLPARGPRLLDVDELEQTQAHLIRRLAALQTALDARAPAGAVLLGDGQQLSDEPQAASAAKRSAGTGAKTPRSGAKKTRPAPAGAS
jgi:DNA-binding transcriptional regulator YhcF (GntR family)